MPAPYTLTLILQDEHSSTEVIIKDVREHVLRESGTLSALKDLHDLAQTKQDEAETAIAPEALS